MKTILKNKSTQQLDPRPTTATTILQNDHKPQPFILTKNRLSYDVLREELISAPARSKEYIYQMYSSPSVKSSAIMALGLCFTFVGYEYSRAASITLLAAEVR